MIGDLFRSSAAALIAHFGDGLTVSLRRPHTLRNRVTGAGLAALTVSGAHLAGVASIALTATALEGGAPAGLRFTIAGNATEYEVQAASTAASSVVTLSISPVLAANAPAGAAVTITRAYGEWTFQAVRSSLELGEQGDGLDGSRRRYHLLASSALPTPETGDLLVDDGATFGVLVAETFRPGSGAAARYRLEVGGRS